MSCLAAKVGSLLSVMPDYFLEVSLPLSCVSFVAGWNCGRFALSFVGRYKVVVCFVVMLAVHLMVARLLLCAWFASFLCIQLMAAQVCGVEVIQFFSGWST